MRKGTKVRPLTSLLIIRKVYQFILTEWIVHNAKYFAIINHVSELSNIRLRSCICHEYSPCSILVSAGSWRQIKLDASFRSVGSPCNSNVLSPSKHLYSFVGAPLIHSFGTPTHHDTLLDGRRKKNYCSGWACWGRRREPSHTRAQKTSWKTSCSASRHALTPNRDFDLSHELYRCE